MTLTFCHLPTEDDGDNDGGGVGDDDVDDDDDDDNDDDSSDLTLKDCVFPFFGTKEERDRAQRLGAEDWSKFLELRSRELKPGGILVTQNLCRPSPEHVGAGDSTPRSSDAEERPSHHVDIHGDLETAWKQLREDEVITQEEYERCVFKVVYRSSQEFKAPFEREESAVSRSGLRLIQYEEFGNSTVVSQDFPQTDHEEGKDYRAHFAESLLKPHQVWSQSTFSSSLSDMRTEAEKATIMADLFDRVYKLLQSKDPRTYSYLERFSRVVARKDMKPTPTK